MYKWLLLAIGITVIDQVTKIWVTHTLAWGEMWPLTPFFNLVLVYNKGAAFGFLAQASGWQHYVFVLVAIIAVVIIIRLLYQHLQQSLFACALSLILGGTLGNVIDRFLYGHVIDFLDLYYQHYHWPAFNVADAAICLGAMLFLLDSWKKR